jgi:putative endonuclease
MCGKKTGGNKKVERKKKGHFAEERAVEYLKKKGYRILDRNFYVRGGEIDIVAEKENVLISVEVRSLSNRNGLNPVETISEFKLRHLKRAMETYMVKKGIYGKVDCRFDVVGVIGQEKPEIIHIEDAYRW